MRKPPLPVKQTSWMLDPDIVFLNHGSFGARPEAVFKAQVLLKEEFENAPIQFLDREGKARVAAARSIVSSFLGCCEKNLGFVENATTAIGCVIHSLQMPAKAEIVTTNHVYNGVRQLLEAAAAHSGWQYREIAVKTPIQSSRALVSTVVNGLREETKLFVIDHVASTTGVVFPVAEIIETCRKRGIAILIDGAHAPGMLSLDIDELSPDWYVGNLHKWVCGPPGAGFLWANDDQLQLTHPMTTSHFRGQGFIEEFDWQGTRDITSILGAAAAVQWGETIGWERIRNPNHDMAVWAQSLLASTWQTDPLTPFDGSLMGSMATVELPVSAISDQQDADLLRDWIYDTYKVEIAVLVWQNTAVVRVSTQLYTTPEDLNRLLDAINALNESLQRVILK